MANTQSHTEWIHTVNNQALGKLMATIGGRMDTERNEFYLQEVFRLLSRHGNNQKINSRLRFMIRDLDELRVSC